jgi:hypothetical protein
VELQPRVGTRHLAWRVKEDMGTCYIKGIDLS